MDSLAHADSIVVTSTPDQVYDLVSDVTRTGEWSPICKACWWDDDAGPRVGAWFTGRNEIPGRTWETRSRVVAAERGREFSWMVGDGYVRWGYDLAAVDDGTLLTESWEFRPEGLTYFAEQYGENAQTEIAARARAAHEGIPATLAAIKRIAEAGPKR